MTKKNNKRKLKILHIIPSFGVGGAEKMVINYLEASKKAGVDLLCISLYPNMGTIYDNIIARKALKVIYLNKRKGFDINLVFELKKQIQILNPDIVHTHLYSLKYYVMTGEYKGRRSFHTIHSTPEVDARRFDYLFNRLLFKTGLIIPIALQLNMRDETNRYYGVSSCKCISNGVFFDDYKRSVYDEQLAKTLGITSKDFVIGHIGRFTGEKNHQYILDLFMLLKERNHDVKVLFVGDGPLLEEFKRKTNEEGMADSVIFVGNRQDVPKLLKLMNIFVFPSKYEGFGLSLIEAQISGVFCLASEYVPKQTMISNGVRYLPIKKESMNEWVEEILKKHDKVELMSNAREYDMDYCFFRLMDLYKEVVEKKYDR